MELTVQKRDIFGKAVKVLRRAGLIPAELYGRGTENIHLTVPFKEFTKVLRAAGESSIINLICDGTKRPVLIHEVSRDPVTDEVATIDFYQVRMDERIKIKVPLHFTGEAPAVKDKSGLLVKAMHELEIDAMPAAIHPAIEVGLAQLIEIGQSIYVKDLVLPADVKTHVSPETVIATVTMKPVEEEVTAAEEVSVESVKVETEEKKTERQLKKEATAAETAEKGKR